MQPCTNNGTVWQADPSVKAPGNCIPKLYCTHGMKQGVTDACWLLYKLLRIKELPLGGPRRSDAHCRASAADVAGFALLCGLCSASPMTLPGMFSICTAAAPAAIAPADAAAAAPAAATAATAVSCCCCVAYNCLACCCNYCLN